MNANNTTMNDEPDNENNEEEIEYRTPDPSTRNVFRQFRAMYTSHILGVLIIGWLAVSIHFGGPAALAYALLVIGANELIG